MNACRKNETEYSPSVQHEKMKGKPTFDDVVNFSRMAIQKNEVISRTPTYYSLEDGKGLLEESLNFTYCRPDTVFLEYDVFVDTVLIPVETTNEIFGTAKWFTDRLLDEAFDEISARAGEYFENLAGSGKEPIQFAVSLEEYGTAFEGDTIEAYYFLVSGLGIDPSTTVVEYGDEDYWFWDDIGGRCPPESGGFGLGAASIFQRDLRRELIPKRLVYSDFYFTNPEISCFHVSGCSGYSFPDLQVVNDFDITYSEGLIYSSGNACLDPDDMNQYYNSMKDDLIFALAPVDKVPSNIFVGYTLGAAYVHMMAVFYSTRIQFTPVPNFPIPLSPE